MSSQLLFSMGLLLLAASIFVFAAYAVSCDADAYHRTDGLNRSVTTWGEASSGASGAYSMWATVGSHTDSASNAFSSGYLDACFSFGWRWLFYEGVSTVWTHQGCSDSDHV